MVAVFPDEQFNAVLPLSSSEAARQQLDHDLLGHRNRVFVLVHPGNAHESKLATVRVFGKVYEVCWRSLFIFPVSRCFRQKVITFVVWKWFDRFILFLIMVNSILLATYQNRANPGSTEEGWNWLVDNVLDPILTVLFTLEFVLKVIAWGFFLDRRSYLRELWNWLDFVVVVTALVAFVPGMDSGLGFLRLFRILRPLRSLKQVPQMKVLVNTVISSIPRLANVSIMMFFFFWIFAIVGITMLDGVFYHGCRTTPAPILLTRSSGEQCWDWPLTGDSRLCGGRYMCDSPPEGVAAGFCGGREDDPNSAVRPVFPGGRQGLPWCRPVDDVFPKIFPETDYIHFDHIGGALLAVFQCMTMEGWTDLMYYIQDGFGLVVGTLYFFALIPITSFFLLNIALAVVDEAREDFEDEDKLGSQTSTTSLPETEGIEQPTMPAKEVFVGGPSGAKELRLVTILRMIAYNEVFTNIIMFFIAGNVVTMCLESFPPVVSLQDFLQVCEKVFLGIFCVEMLIMLGAMGPKRYVMNPITCFDGFIVLVSLFQACFDGGGSAFTALRTLRLFRVLNKLAHRWPSFRVLLKAMVQTGISLNYWLVLFFLFLYIWTLMWMNFFNRQFHFEDLDTFSSVSRSQGKAWCAGAEGEVDIAYRQDCVPRAHFDTFLWAFVTIFQIMTGENWNWIMYAGMRAQHWVFAVIFIALIVFGQILFLSLFLSMLMSKFNKVQDCLEKQKPPVKKKTSAQTRKLIGTLVSGIRMKNKAKAAVTRAAKRTASEQSERQADSDGDAAAGGILNTPPHQIPSLLKKPSEGMHSSHSLPGQPDMDGNNEEVYRPHVAEVSAPKPWQADEQDAEEIREIVSDKDYTLPKDEARVVETEAPPLLPTPSSQRWPHGYAWFVLSERNLLRRGCRWVLSKQVAVLGSDINAFDNFVLLCILVSTVCMALDTPLRNPGDPLTKVLRGMDFVFKIIFVAEMAIKLLAMGLIWGRDAYLRSAWNWLDGIVVVVSIVGMVTSGSTGFLKTLRILRAFRPLRVISRNENLKVVVQTIFASLPALVTLVIVCLVFLLIFALFAMSYLSGTFYNCQVGSTPIALEKDLGATTPATPLCLSPLSEGHVHSACPRGLFNSSRGSWVQDGRPCPTDSANCAHSHPELSLAWQRLSADVPICVGRCDLHNSGNAPEWLCPRRYQSLEELPHNCEGPRTTLPPRLIAAEQVGLRYQAAMTRALVMPCGGTAVVDGGLVEDAASAASCRAAFCPGTIPEEKRASCEANCRIHPHFCIETCTGPEDSSAKCTSCRKECEAACHCDGHCEPLIKDAALCHEQGGSWVRSLPQTFDNVWSALLTLFEISSTEGWVDVMYAACDSREPYLEPKRDAKQWVFAPFFVFYIFISFMFLLNLSVGVIVDNFMDLKQSGTKVLLTPAQQQWIKSQKKLLVRTTLFHMTNLHLLPKLQRRVYDFAEGKPFEIFMTGALVVNTIVLATKAYPWPTPWWEGTIQALDYVFIAVFLTEFLIKYYAFRSHYWMDCWNRFDFACVVVAIFGALLGFVAPDMQMAKSISQLFRVFRIARLFRLLRTPRLNQIFMAFLLSLPKLGNVLMVLLLLMTLYGILGVSLFSTVKHSDWLNVHGNFMDFGWAFITLFRAVTGEAWNSIMHDLLKTEMDFFREGSWCTPNDLFDTDTEENYNLLSSKCLLEKPNSCVQSIGGINIFPAIYWITYILFIQLMVMNLVIAVILEGYEDGRRSPENEVIDLCIKKWEMFDREHRMTISLFDAIQFIEEVMHEWAKEKGNLPNLHLVEGARITEDPTAPLGCDCSRLPMSYVRRFELVCSEDGRVHWLSVSKEVVRFACTQDNDLLKKEIQSCQSLMDPKSVERLGKLENRQRKMVGLDQDDHKVDLRTHVAAIKVQRAFKRGLRKAQAHVKLQQEGKTVQHEEKRSHRPGSPRHSENSSAGRVPSERNSSARVPSEGAPPGDKAPVALASSERSLTLGGCTVTTTQRTSFSDMAALVASDRASLRRP